MTILVPKSMLLWLWLYLLIRREICLPGCYLALTDWHLIDEAAELLVEHFRPFPHWPLKPAGKPLISVYRHFLPPSESFALQERVLYRSVTTNGENVPSRPSSFYFLLKTSHGDGFEKGRLYYVLFHIGALFDLTLRLCCHNQFKAVGYKLLT